MEKGVGAFSAGPGARPLNQARGKKHGCPAVRWPQIGSVSGDWTEAVGLEVVLDESAAVEEEAVADGDEDRVVGDDRVVVHVWNLPQGLKTS